MADDRVLVCADVGSTFTKVAAVDAHGRLLGTAQAPTTAGTDVLDGLDTAAAALGVGRVRDARLLVCSSAGGGLRLAVIGQERVVSAEAGRRVALSAGARVVGVWAGRLRSADLEAVVAAEPDVVLLVGGTDGGDPEVLVHNARTWGRRDLPVPVVVAGNAEVADDAVRLARGGGRTVLRAANVLPRIGVLDPEPARAVIREVFVKHVIGGKGLSSGRRFARLVSGATPDVVLTGAEVLAACARKQVVGDVLVIDVGGATTDVLSALAPPTSPADDAGGADEPVVGRTVAARTVEGDLGMRWSAPDVVRAAQAERLLPADQAPGRSGSVDLRTASYFAGLSAAAARRHADPGLLPATEEDRAVDLELAALAATIAVRRHARPDGGGRDLRDVGLVVGSGGVLRHADPDAALAVLDRVLSDRAGGWARPVAARTIVDRDYLLAPIGLLALSGRGEQAAQLAARLLAEQASR